MTFCIQSYTIRKSCSRDHWRPPDVLTSIFTSFSQTGFGGFLFSRQFVVCELVQCIDMSIHRT